MCYYARLVRAKVVRLYVEQIFILMISFDIILLFTVSHLYLYHSIGLNNYLHCINEFIQVLFIPDRFPQKDICLPIISSVNCLVEYGALGKNIDKNTILISIYKFVKHFWQSHENIPGDQKCKMQ